MTNQIIELEAQLDTLEKDPNPQIKHKVDILNELAWAMRYSELNRCLELSMTAYELTLAIEGTPEAYLDGHLTSLRNLVYFQGLTGEFDQAFRFSMLALGKFDQLPTLTTLQKELKAAVLSNMGMVSAFMGYYSEAAEFCYQSIDLATEIDDSWSFAQSVNHLGFIHAQSGEYNRAIKSISQGVQFMKRINDQGGIALQLNNLAWAYSLAGDYENGLKNALESMALAKKLDAAYLKSIIFDTTGELYLKLGEFEKGQAFLEEAVTISKQTKYKYGEVVALMNLGKVLYHQEKPAALEVFAEAITVGEEVGTKYEVAQCHLYISKYHEERGQLTQALFHFQQYHRLQKELFNSETEKKVKYLEVLHATETAKKELEIYQLRNVALEHEVNERLRAEKELNEYKDHLEEVVHRRTSELTIANEQLQHEINHKIKIESALRESEERHRLISELISDYAYVYTIDEQENFTLEWVTDASFSRLTGYSWFELDTPYDLYHPADTDRVYQDVMQSLRGKTTIGEYRIFTKEGRLRWIQTRRQPVWDDDLQRATKMSCVVQDITERKLAETQLVENAAILSKRNQELQNFTHISSHDLQEPLRKIQLFSERLKDRYQENLDERGRHYLTRIHDAAARSRLLIQDLLAYSQLADDTFETELVNLDVVVSQVIDDLTVRIEETAASVQLHNLPTIEANASMMYQLFLNLIVNALKFHAKERPPIIEISGQQSVDENRCEILVKDNGIGFDEKHAERIFSIFQRLHDRSEFAGTGIGLTICRRIVEQHHGQITASSKANIGTEFRLVLPLQQPKQKRDTNDDVSF